MQRNLMLKGFTLVEIIVVLGIIGLLAGAVLTTLNPLAQLEKGRDARRKIDLDAIKKGLELYYQDHNEYPSDGGNYWHIHDADTGEKRWGDPWQPYMAAIPFDPRGGTEVTGNHADWHYQYVVYQSGQAYCLYANLERGKNDPQACNNGNKCTNLATLDGSGLAHCGDSTHPCNYGICSSNQTP